MVCIYFNFTKDLQIPLLFVVKLNSCHNSTLYRILSTIFHGKFAILIRKGTLSCKFKKIDFFYVPILLP